MRRGFRLSGTLSGTYALDARPQEHRRFVLRLEARARSLLAPLRTGETEVSGRVDADELAAAAPAIGRLIVPSIRGRTIGCELEFTGDDRRRYRLVADSALRLGDLRRSMTQLPGRLLDDSGTVIGSCQLQFDTRADLLDLMASWRRG
jgi:hypothetical protein